MTTRDDGYRFHILDYSSPQTTGVVSRWTQDLKPVRGRDLKTGELVELLVAVDGRKFTLDDQSVIRFDIVEEDFLFTGLGDDRIVALMGTGATAPEEGFATDARTTFFVRRADGQSLSDAVADFKRLHPADFKSAIVVFASGSGAPEFHILAWWETTFVEDWGSPEFRFIVNVTARFDDRSDETISVIRDAVPAAGAAGTVKVRLSGKLLDANPLDPNKPEPLHAITVRGGGAAIDTDRNGAYKLDASFVPGEEEVEIKRTGIEPVVLLINLEAAAENLTVTLRRKGDNTAVAKAVTAPIRAVPARIELAVDDIKIVAHKIRGVVCWPDSRRLLASAGPVAVPAIAVGAPGRPHGTPAGRKRVFAIPAPAGRTADNRPASSGELAKWAARPGVIGSGRPGSFPAGEITTADGAFEIKYIDLTAKQRYFLWVESPEHGAIDTSPTSPEFVVRTVGVRLQRITGAVGDTDARADNLELAETDLIDHQYNLMTGSVAWSVEALKVVDFPIGAATELRVLRPDRTRAVRTEFDDDVSSGERLTFDRVTKIVSGLTIDSLPLVPINEPVDQASDRARRARLEFLSECATEFPRGVLLDDVQFVLDSQRIDDSVDMVTAAAWTAGEPNADARRCALLENTLVALPAIPTGSVARIEDAVWRCDAITLADFARITSPAVARVATRRLTGRWVAVLHRVVPRLTGLLADRHVYLAPGHGLYDNNPAGSAGLNGWVAYRGGYVYGAGEDENDAHMAATVARILEKHDARFSCARELSDYTLPGVTHLANDAFAAGNRQFIRRWQQNPVYALGAAGSPLVIGQNPGQRSRQATPPPLPNGKGHDNDGVTLRVAYGASLASGRNPIDAYLAIHTNALNQASRGTLALYNDVWQSNAARVESNQLGLAYCGRLAAEVSRLCGTNNTGPRSVRTNGGTNYELQRTYEHFTRDPNRDVFPAGNQSEWQWVRIENGPLPALPPAPAAPAGTLPPQPWAAREFPARPAPVHRIPVAIIEVAYHDQPDEAALLSRQWFRRLAAEAMSLATEDQLRAAPTPITRADMSRMLAAVFGPTPAIRGLVADGTPITNDIARYIREATQPAPVAGAPAPAAVADDGSLDSAAAAIDDVAGRPVAAYTRRAFIEALRDTLAERCGFAGDAKKAIAASPPDDITSFVTDTLLWGAALPALTRSSAAPTRGEAGELVALALGLRPATLAETIKAAPDKKTLMKVLDGDAHADKLLARRDAEDILKVLAALPPESFYVIADIILADEKFVPLPYTGDPEHVYAVRTGARITFVATTRGVPWEIGSTEPRFTIEHKGHAVTELGTESRTRERLTSKVWPAAFPIPEGDTATCKVTLTLKHRTLSATLTKTVTFKVGERT